MLQSSIQRNCLFRGLGRISNDSAASMLWATRSMRQSLGRDSDWRIPGDLLVGTDPIADFPIGHGCSSDPKLWLHRLVAWINRFIGWINIEPSRGQWLRFGTHFANSHILLPLYQRGLEWARGVVPYFALWYQHRKTLRNSTISHFMADLSQRQRDLHWFRRQLIDSASWSLIDSWCQNSSLYRWWDLHCSR